MPMPIEYGSDIAGLEDLDRFFSLRRGGEQVRESIGRRFLTESDGEHGYDLREWLGEVIDAEALTRLRADMEAECFKDERVEKVRIATTFDPVKRALHIDLTVEGAFTTFVLVFLLTDTVTVLPET